MRAFVTVLRWLSPGIFSLAVLLTASSTAQADTGTYNISDYVVTLDPQSSGAVRITYEQTWQVLSGNIPWITVGLPNSKFVVEDWSGAAARAYADNSAGWSGVRVDLDRAYLPGETFSVKFTVLQSNLLERLTSEKKWRIDYTPGWYDRTGIGHLQINLKSQVSLDSYSLIRPVPLSSQNGVITWSQSDVPSGYHLEIRVECLDGSFLSATAPDAKKGTSPWTFLIVILCIAAFIAVVVLAVRRNKQANLKRRIAATERAMATDAERREEVEKGFREYVIEEDIKPDEQGRYYDRSYGGYIPPAIWAAVILEQQRRQTYVPPATSHGNTPSCACACVACACACACACAGGGAAGCSQKTMHECGECQESDNDLEVTGGVWGQV